MTPDVTDRLFTVGDHVTDGANEGYIMGIPDRDGAWVSPVPIMGAKSEYRRFEQLTKLPPADFPPKPPEPVEETIDPGLRELLHEMYTRRANLRVHLEHAETAYAAISDFIARKYTMTNMDTLDTETGVIRRNGSATLPT